MVSAGILIWVFCGLATLVMGVSALVMLVAPDLVLDELARQNPDYAQQGVTDAAIVTATWISAVVVVCWSVAASILAVFVVRGRRSAWLPLVISTALAAVFCLLGVWVSLVMVLPLAACAVTLSLLLRGDVRAWLGSA